jgi:hypothetical protein
MRFVLPTMSQVGLAILLLGSSALSLPTLAASRTPANPSALQATPLGVESIALGWKAGSGGAAVTGYKVAYRTGSSPSSGCTNGTVITVGNAAKTTIASLATKTTYYFRVCALAGNVVSTGATVSAATAAGSGSRLWSRVQTDCVGGDCRNLSCAVDGAGNVYVGGTDSANGGDAYVKKYDETGVEIASGWNKRFGDAVGEDFAKVVRVDAAGNVYVGGWRANAVASRSQQDMMVRKYSANGTLLWEYVADHASREQIRGMAFGSGETYLYVVGNIGNDGDIANMRYAIKKLRASDGAEVAANVGMQCGNDGKASWNMVAVDKTGDDATDTVFIAGVGVNCLTPTSSNDGVLFKLTSDLAVATDATWPVVMGDGRYNTFTDIDLDASGHVYVAGRWTDGNGLWDIILKRFDAVGNEDPAWSRRFDYGGQDAAGGLLVDGGGQVYLGTFSSAAPGAMPDWRLKKFSAAGTEDVTHWNFTSDVNGSKSEDLVESSCRDPRSGAIVYVGSSAVVQGSASSKRGSVQKYMP